MAALPVSAGAGTYDLTVDRVTIDTGRFVKTGIGYNGSFPGPVLRFQEGEDVTINVTNNLGESTSIHWHGLILPFRQDGVPGISFDGIAPGETFTYRFPIVQSGTYWFHSHSGLQEPEGAFGAIVIEPKEREPFRYDRDYVVQLTDKHPHRADRIMRNLKMMPDYYNRQQRTLGDLIADARRDGLGAALKERRAWGSMRMMPTDIEDVQGYVPLINGKNAAGNWTGLFTPGERVRLRFVNSSAMAYFDIRIPGLEMTVVQADGQNVQPVTVDELRIAVAETYDVIVRPTEDRAYTIYAESMGRTAFGRGTLAPRPGMSAEVPEMRSPPLLTMADMGMAHGGHAGMDHGAMPAGGSNLEGHTVPAMPQGQHTMPDGTVMPGMEHGGPGAPQGHRMPDGTTMPGMQHETPAAGHQMPDGSLMPGMDPGAVRQSSKSSEAASWQAFLSAPAPRATFGVALPPGTRDASKTASATHTMPDGTVMAGTDHAAMDRGTHRMPDGSTMSGMQHAVEPQQNPDPVATMPVDQGAAHAMPAEGTMPGMDHSTMARAESDPFYASGSGLTPVAAEPGGKVLSYSDLKAQAPLYPDREPTREIELRLTGNMERYVWSINGVKYEDAEPIVLTYGERVRFKFVNETMMSHPMHLHGMWSILDTGNGQWNPLKHTVSVAPGTTLYTETEVDAPGEWAFHCHLAYHMMGGMFRKVVVQGGPETAGS